jgi:hypothetical protein
LPLLAANRFAPPRNLHCSLLNDRWPREASSAALDRDSPFFRREQWHTGEVEDDPARET